jgi:two-component system sensor histidine kinase KdpD
MEKADLYMRVSRHAEDLERIVEERTRELETVVRELSVALERAKEADKVKSLLLSTVSHELRTPLATIKGNTSLLQEYHRQLPASDLDAHLRDIEEETDKLTELISNLMEMSRIEGGSLHIQREPIDIGEVLRNSIDAARLRLESTSLSHHRIDLQVDRHVPMVLGDARRVEQILANLLDNAAKFSPDGSPVAVTARVEDNQIVISVRDHGKGIPPEHIDHIFERFYQVAERGDAHRQGIGLGLAICKGLVEAHQGHIWVSSEVGIGSTFSFSLPFAVPVSARQG